jgi:hypothetical protein
LEGKDAIARARAANLRLAMITVEGMVQKMSAKSHHMPRAAAPFDAAKKVFQINNRSKFCNSSSSLLGS